MEKINVEDAVGTVLAHDMTRIIPEEFKGVGFKKGHVVREEDIPELLKIGKRSLYVLNLSNNQLHEDDAALRIARAVIVQMGHGGLCMDCEVCHFPVCSFGR